MASSNAFTSFDAALDAAMKLDLEALLGESTQAHCVHDPSREYMSASNDMYQLGHTPAYADYPVMSAPTIDGFNQGVASAYLTYDRVFDATDA